MQLGYLLNSANKFINTLTFGTVNLARVKRYVFDGLPLGDATGDGTGEIFLKVGIVTYNGSGGTLVVGGAVDNFSGGASQQILAVGGKTVPFNTYAPGYTTNDYGEFAFDNNTGGLLVQKIKGPPTSTQTNVAAAASNTTLLAANTARRGAIIKNGSNTVLHVCLAGTGSVANASYDLAAYASGIGGVVEIPFDYTGVITGFSEGAPTGNVNITELT